LTKNSLVSVSTRLDASLCDAEHGWLPKRCAFLKYYSMDKVQKRSCVIKFSHAQFSGFSACGNLAMLALVWLCRVWFTASYANLRGFHILKHHKKKKKNLILHLNKYSNVFDYCLIEILNLIRIFLRYVMLCLMCSNHLY
jgi:hypothetical protein